MYLCVYMYIYSYRNGCEIFAAQNVFKNKPTTKQAKQAY